MSKMAEKLLRRLEFTVLKRLDGLLHGDYRTLFRGYGLDLADLREYQFHDDVRHIDWNVTARMDIPHVRDFHEDREMSAWFLLDLSASVDFGSGEVTKRSLSVDFVTVMARLLTGHGNRVGGIFYSDRIDRVIPARGSRRHVLGMVDAMLAPRLVRAGTTTRLEDLLVQAARIIPRRSVVFVVSDFLSEPGWAAAMQRLTHRHEVIGVRLYDPLELALPDLGMVVMQDAETGEQMFVDTHDKRFRRRFEAQAQAREEALQDAFAEAGIDAFELATDEPMADAVIRFSELRKIRGRLGAGGVRGARGPATAMATGPAATSGA